MMKSKTNRYIILSTLASELQGHTDMIPDNIKTKDQLNKKIMKIIKQMQRVAKELDQQDWNTSFSWKDEKPKLTEVAD